MNTSDNCSHSIDNVRESTMKKIMLIILFSMVGLEHIVSVQAQQLSLTEIQQTIRTGRLDQAVRLLDKYIHQNPDSINAYILLARVHLAIGGFNERTAAESVLLKAYRLDKQNAEILKLLSEIKGNQGMPEQSTKYLEKAIKVVPTDHQVLNKLLDLYIRLHSKSKVKEIELTLKEALEKNSENPLMYLSLGKLKTYMGDSDTAVAILKKGLKFDPKNPAIHRTLSEAYLFIGYGDEFTEEYLNWLETEQDYNELNREFEIAAMIMPADEAGKFNKIEYKEKRDYLLRFWRENDPYPVTSSNERLVEHVRRVLYSKALFHTIQGNLGFDDRGKVYIRLGEPEDRFLDPAPKTTYLEDGVFTNLEFIPRSNESWYYPSYGYYMAFDFVSYGGDYYHEVASLDEIYPRAFLGIGQIFYKDRDHLGGIYTSLANSSDYANRVREFITESVSVKRGAKPRYEIALDLKKLEYVYKTFQFRGDSGKTRVEWAYSVPLKQLQSPSKNDSAMTYLFQSDFILIDSLFKRNLHTQSKRKFVCPRDLDYSKLLFLSEEKYNVFSGKYNMTLQIIENVNKIGDYSTEPLNVRNFSGDSLMISDLKFSQQVSSFGVDSTTGRENLYIMPYPFSSVKKMKPIYLYFEIYNLFLEPEQKSKYNISLSVARRIKKEEYVTLPLQVLGKIFTGGKTQSIETTYNRESNSRSVVEYILLDISGLQNGNSRLTVMVEDLLANKKQQNSIEFELED